MLRGSVMRMLAALALVAGGCGSKHHAAATPRAQAAPAAPPTLLTFLGGRGAGPPDGLGGWRLGEHLVGAADRRVAGADFSGRVHAFTAPDGNVRHVVVEVTPHGGDDALAAAERQLTARWGAPREAFDRHAWRGARSQLVLGAYGGALAGGSSLMVDLLPPDETHVCGKDDGFDAFFEAFRAARWHLENPQMVARIAGMIDHARDGLSLCHGGTDAWLACTEPMLTRLARERAHPYCDVSSELYRLSTPGDPRGGAYFSFRKGGDGAWRILGPFALAVDDRLDPRP